MGDGVAWEPASTRQTWHSDVDNNFRSVTGAIFDFHLQAYE